MADYTYYDKTTTERIYEVELPTNWVEVQKMLSALSNELSSVKTYDDTVTVDSDGEKLYFRYKK